jgi:hypothetical protein
MLANVISNSTQQVGLDGFSVVGVIHKATWAFKPFDAGLYLDGSLEGSSALNSNLPNHSAINVGAAGTGGNRFWGWIRNVRIYQERKYI